jgi:hypothetical protein
MGSIQRRKGPNLVGFFWHDSFLITMFW